ncbi:hypothetical protein HZA57_00505 [Candidatus Poribacteria bacterium]|nr:hypothetical protein [Candidatus Poribacteria bacterium]
MRDATVMTPAEIRMAAHDAILRELGMVGLIRFMQDQSLGSGDYTRDRANWLPDYQSVEELIAETRTTVKGMRERGELGAIGGSGLL